MSASARLHPVYCDKANTTFIEIAFVTEGDQRYAISIDSLTLDNQLYTTCNTVGYRFDIPWTHVEPITIDGPLNYLVGKMLDSHRNRVHSLELQTIDANRYPTLSRELSARVGNWLIEQAPLPEALLAKYAGQDWPVNNKQASALVLIGFCSGASKDYDRVAIDAFRQQKNAAGKSATDAASLVAVHAMSNEYHLASLFPELFPEAELILRLDREWLPRTVKLGKTDWASVEGVVRELQQRSQLREVGSIESPFKATLYQKADRESAEEKRDRP